MATVGIDRRTGKVLRGWDHVKQSIEDIITTVVMSRVMVRDYGANAAKLIDVNMSQRALLAFFVTVATALVKWEPRFELTDLGYDQLSPDGRVTLRLSGFYYERGAEGDRSISLEQRWEMTL